VAAEFGLGEKSDRSLFVAQMGCNVQQFDLKAKLINPR